MLEIPLLGINTYLEKINSATLNNLKNIIKKCLNEGIRCIYMEENKIITEIILNEITFSNLDRKEYYIIYKINKNFNESDLIKLFDEIEFIDLVLVEKDFNINEILDYTNQNKIKNVGIVGSTDIKSDYIFNKLKLNKLSNGIFIPKNYINLNLIDLTIKYNVNVTTLLLSLFIKKNKTSIIDISSIDEISEYLKSLNLNKFIEISDLIKISDEFNLCQ
jgi:hypothetical protein